MLPLCPKRVLRRDISIRDACRSIARGHSAASIAHSVVDTGDRRRVRCVHGGVLARYPEGLGCCTDDSGALLPAGGGLVWLAARGFRLDQPGRGTRSGFHIWVWVGLVLAASILTLGVQWAGWRRAQDGPTERALVANPPADLALFCLVTALLGTGMFLWFLVKLTYFPQNWYYIELLVLWAVVLDGILTASWPELVPWGAFRTAFLVLIMLASSGAAFREAHTRRSNVDLVAAIVRREVSDGDLVVIQDVWDAITFNRYYSGRAHWMTVPPIDSHKVHRNDLVLDEMKQADAMATVIEEANRVLRSGHTVWSLGDLPIAGPEGYCSCLQPRRFRLVFCIVSGFTNGDWRRILTICLFHLHPDFPLQTQSESSCWRLAVIAAHPEELFSASTLSLARPRGLATTFWRGSSLPLCQPYCCGEGDLKRRLSRRTGGPAA